MALDDEPAETRLPVEAAGRPAETRLPVEAAGRPVALVYRALGLGDLLTAVPALRALRRALPKHRIVLATDPGLSPLIPLIRAVDEVWPARALQPLAWPRPAPDVAVNLHGRGPQSHELLMDLRPHRLVAFADEDLCVAGPRWQEDEHEVRRWCRLVESSLHRPAPPDDLLLALPGVPPPVHAAVVVHPGAAAAERRWPAERFAAVARRLGAGGWPVVVTGSPAEESLARSICTSASLPDAAALAGKTPLAQLAALVAAARVVVCNDTGVAHLANAFGTPSVVLFGPESPIRWGPPASGPHIVLWHGSGLGEDHGDDQGNAPGDPVLHRIQVDEVVRAAESLLPVRSP